MLEWTVDQYEQYCRENHNACFLLLLIGPTMLCCLAKILPRGKPSRLTTAQLQVFSMDSTWTENFPCWMTEFIEGTSNIMFKCLLSTIWSLFLMLSCSKRAKQAFSSWLLAYCFLLTFGSSFESYTLLGQAVPVAFLEKHWWHSNNNTAVLKPWVRNKLVPRRSVDTCVCIMTIISKKKEKENN